MAFSPFFSSINTALLKKNVVQETTDTISNVSNLRIANVAVDEIANKITQGFRPLLFQNLWGSPQVRYIAKPKQAAPRIFLALHYKMCSFLGDYGAGKTLNTFSLLPGEKTTISIRSFLRNETTVSKSENVLDSFSESSANELQNSIESEFGYQTSSDMSELIDIVGTFGYQASAKATVGVATVKAKTSVSVGAEYSTSLNENISEQINNLTSAVSNHTSQSNSVREVEVNTETTSTAISEQEETITRILENINKSRVLNFVFRQLLQEYFTITYLNDVHIVYTNGYPESQLVSSIANIDGLLQKVIPAPANIAQVKNSIFNYLCNIEDYTGTKVSFIEKVDESVGNCIDPNFPPLANSYVRKRKDLSQTYNGKTVNGIILNVTHRVLRTPAVIVDSLLGQGEALDCYNMKLQNAATIQADLENAKLQQAIDLINALPDAETKAKLYKKIFTDCCDVPQSSCGCTNTTTTAK